MEEIKPDDFYIGLRVIGMNFDNNREIFRGAVMGKKGNFWSVKRDDNVTGGGIVVNGRRTWEVTSNINKELY